MNQKASGKTSGQPDDKQGFIPVASLLQDVYADLEKKAGNPIEITGMTMDSNRWMRTRMSCTGAN